MTDSPIRIEVQGLDRIVKAFDKFPQEIFRNMKNAGHEAANRVILPTEGLQKYPPMGEGNQPPTPYYIRGRGMQYKYGNNASSERLGAQWHTKQEGLNMILGNRASYAPYVHGKEQARWMAPIGWRKLLEVAQEKVTDITKVYQAWVNKTIRDLGL